MVSEILKSAEDRMKKAIEATGGDFHTMRAGRANPALLDRINVDYYGTPTPVNQLASVSVPDPRTLVIQPWDKASLTEIERAIQKSDLGLNPMNDGQVVRLPVPPLTEERRKELLKIVRHMAEDGRVAVRNIRRDANEHLKRDEKNHEISEDDLKRAQEQVQKITDKYIKELDQMLDNKEKDLLEV